MAKLIYHDYTKVSALCLIIFLMISCNQNSVSVPGASRPKITDVTKDATLTVNHENPGGADATEGSNSLIDGDKQTKFLIFDYSSDFWAQQAFSDAVKVNAYTVTSGNDAPGRDPKDWTLQGSDDGSSWETIATQTDVNFPIRNQTKIYHLDSDVSYQYYRFNITADQGGGNLMQWSEWRLLYYESQN